MIKHHDFHINFIRNKKYYFIFSLIIIFIGLVFNIVFGTKMDIKFTGGAIVHYSYSGETISADNLRQVVESSTGKTATISLSQNLVTANENDGKNNAAVEFSGNEALSIDGQNALNEAINKAYPDSGFQLKESTSVDPSNGRSFFLKCMTALGLASVLMIIYIALRFRKIGGWSAGVMAVVSLLHDVVIIYVTFILFGMKIDDNFIAVVLTIIGYSLNDTIIIYDRIRENRKLYGPKASTPDIVNLSINQTLNRTINTTVTTALAIATVLVVSLIFNVTSVVAFAFPMLVGIVFGCYSTICIAGPLWVMWKNRENKKLGIIAVSYTHLTLPTNREV
eukprot:TRINITY_DN5791_c0_g1_i19.p1 TRINITY_DN5791_c0_g1~~TRINITY_DN5791_c0_g1_i19.p1  ORF type:complete len:336 (-),score=-43.75 TRINITY_DN5791_c0_g1_i19:38-1045(-)